MFIRTLELAIGTVKIGAETAKTGAVVTEKETSILSPKNSPITNI